MKILSIISVLCLVACVSSAKSNSAEVQQQRPAWVVTSVHPKYPKSLYWVGVGISSDGQNKRDKAIDLARREISTQLSVSLKSEVNMRTQSLMKNFSEDIEQSVLDKIETKTELVDVSGIEIVETYQGSDKEFYALGALNKEKYLGKLKDELDEMVEQVEGYKKDMENALSRGDIKSAYESLTQARQTLVSFVPKIAYYNALDYDETASYNKFTIQSLTKVFISAINNITIEKINGDNQQGKITEPFQKDFAIKATINGEPLVSLPIVAKYKNNVLGKALTDAQGIASMHLYPIADMAKQANATVDLSIELESLPMSARKALEKAKVSFSTKVEMKAFPYSLEITGVGSSNAKGLLYTKLVDLIKSFGGVVQKTAPINIKCALQTLPKKTIQGFGSVTNIQQVSMVMAIVEGGESVRATLSAKAQSVGKSDEEAITNAMLALPNNIDKSQLSGSFENISSE